MTRYLVSFFEDECATTSVEYTVIAAFIALLIIAGVSLIGTDLAGIFESIPSSI